MTRATQASLARLEEIVGREHMLSDTASLHERQVDGLTPSAVVRPGDSAEVAETLRYAGSERLAVIPSGSGTKLSIGSRPSAYDISLDLSRMNRVLSYDPHDLTLGVEPGIRMRDLLHVLSDQKQFLPLAVSFADRATVGGVVASNSTSPLRHAYGGIRDFCLGCEFVTGEGVAAKSGGRVVKNVTGYDLHKLLIGSLGTLAVMTRINFRTFPLPPAHATFVASFSGDTSRDGSNANSASNSGAVAAFGFCRAIAHSVLTPQMVEVVDPAASHLLFSSHSPSRIDSQRWSVIISAAGQPEVVDRYAHELGHLAGTAGADEFVRLEDTEGHSVFARICEFPNLIRDAVPRAAIFRISITPTAMPTLVGHLAALVSRDAFDLVTLTHASGIMYVALLPEEGVTPPLTVFAQKVQAVFNLCGKSEIGASAMLEWCPTDMKTSAAIVWGPVRQEFGLMQRVKRVFDPNAVLSPGRFAGDGKMGNT